MKKEHRGCEHCKFVLDHGVKPDLTGHTFECRWGPPATVGIPQYATNEKTGEAVMTGIANVTLPILVNPDFWCWHYQGKEPPKGEA
jgi:hypothetical protein